MTLHTKLVLLVTALLIVGGTLLFFILERSNPATLAGRSLPHALALSLFQAVVPRTAGFSILSVGEFRDVTLVLVMFLMFVGASPGGTGGGVKTTTLAILIASAWCYLRGCREVQVLERRIPFDVVLQAVTLVMVSAAAILFVAFTLSLWEGMAVLPLLFEATSAFGTVGLSTGITPQLSPPGLVLLSFLMYMGRLGPVTLGLALVVREARLEVRFPEERVAVG